MKDARQFLKAGITELGFQYTEDQINAFIIYLEELKKWNRAHSLTSLKTDEDIIVRHFLDSLLFSKVMPPEIQSAADIGSGAGFPGIPVKIANPNLKIFLIEPTKKKAIFLRHICSRLGLKQTEVIDKRIEEIEELKVDAAVTRALFSVGEFIKKTKKLLNKNGVLILSKGPKLNEELKTSELKNISVFDLKLPFQNITRHLVVVKTY